MRTVIFSLVLASLVAGCSRRDEPDAYGNVEAT